MLQRRFAQWYHLQLQYQQHGEHQCSSPSRKCTCRSSIPCSIVRDPQTISSCHVSTPAPLLTWYDGAGRAEGQGLEEDSLHVTGLRAFRSELRLQDEAAHVLYLLLLSLPSLPSPFTIHKSADVLWNVQQSWNNADIASISLKGHLFSNASSLGPAFTYSLWMLNSQPKYWLFNSHFWTSDRIHIKNLDANVHEPDRVESCGPLW